LLEVFRKISVLVVVVVVLVNVEKVELRHSELLRLGGNNNNSHVTQVLRQTKDSTSFIDLQLCVK
jgi:hypothetical protein